MSFQQCDLKNQQVLLYYYYFQLVSFYLTGLLLLWSYASLACLGQVLKREPLITSKFSVGHMHFHGITK